MTETEMWSGSEEGSHVRLMIVVSLNSRLDSHKEEASRVRAHDLREHPRFRVRGSGFRVQGSGFRVQGSGFRVWGGR